MSFLCHVISRPIGLRPVLEVGPAIDVTFMGENMQNLVRLFMSPIAYETYCDVIASLRL